MIRFLAFAFVLGLIGCGEQYRQTEDYGLRTSADLTLTENNHPHGFGQTECFVCHNPGNIHNVNRLGDSSFSLAKDLVNARGLQSCSGCHGRNGVTQ